MNVFDKAFHPVLQDVGQEKVILEAIIQCLEKQGVSLSSEQKEHLKAQIKDAELNKSVMGPLSLSVDDIFDAEETVTLNEEDFKDQVAHINPWVDKVCALLPQILEETSSNLLDTLKHRSTAMLEEHKMLRKGFEARLFEVWGTAIDLLETLQVIAVEAGQDYNFEFRSKAAEEQNFVFDALTKLQARACAITNEVLTLLRSGFADGAHARWRTLHEVAVVSLFIAQHGKDVAERYLLHNDIESYKAAVKQQRYSSRLEGMASEENVAILRSVRERLLNRFGPSYGNQYGWAATALENANPNFADIEQSVNLDHLRPYYQLASHNVHANPKGVFFSLATNSQGNALLCGPSNAGLADPGHSTAISLAQATINLLTMHPNIDRLVLSKVMLKMTDEIGGMFLAAHDHVKSRTVPQKPIN